MHGLDRHTPGRPSRALAIACSLLAAMSSVAAMEPWETTLPLEPQARARVVQLCKTSAKETIHATVEGISTVRWSVPGHAAFATLFVDSESEGLDYQATFSSPFEPLAVEVDAVRFPDPMNKSQRPVARYGPGRRAEFRDDYTAPITMTYTRASTDDDERLGIYGRTIAITENATGRLLGERTEYFWLVPPGFQRGRRAHRAICPSLGIAQVTPTYFVAQVINPVTVPCRRERSEAQTKLDALPLPTTGAGWASYAAQKERINLNTPACHQRAQQKLPPPAP